MNRKILVPLATLLAAGAVAVGSGASFVSESENSISSVTSGTLTQLNSKANAAIFDLTDLKPGDVLKGGLTLTNTGSLPATFSLTEVASSNGFTAGTLDLTITNDTTGAVITTGNFGALVDGAANDLGVIEPGDTSDFTFKVTLAQAATNVEQGKTATASYKWDSVQLSGTTTTQ